MKLFKISQTVNKDYDTYDSAVVCAENVDEARKMHPYGNFGYTLEDWCDMKDVEVEYIGEAGSNVKKGVIVASFHAG